MMKTRLHRIAYAIAPLILLSVSSQSSATSTDVVLNLEGNPTCSSLGDNSAVLELRDSSPASSKTLTLPTPSGSQTLAYLASFGSGNTNASVDEWRITSVTDNGTTYSETDAEFTARVYPINYVILKAQNGSKGGRVFHFGSAADGDGAVSDTDEEVPGPNINAISFCYGLTRGVTTAEPPISLADLPDCREIDINNDQVPGDLYTTGITCPPVGGEQQLIVNMALNKSNFGFDFLQQDAQNNIGIRACTCNVTLPACNPELGPVLKGTQPADLPAEERSCLEYTTSDETGDGIPEGVNVRVPFSIQGVENPDSYVCYNIGGRRYCYGHY